MFEAANYDVTLIVNDQSEITVAGVVDMCLMPAIGPQGRPAAGHQKGILAIADVVAINKTDSDRSVEASAVTRNLAVTLRPMQHDDAWIPPVLTSSDLTDEDIDECGIALCDTMIRSVLMD